MISFVGPAALHGLNLEVRLDMDGEQSRVFPWLSTTASTIP